MKTKSKSRIRQFSMLLAFAACACAISLVHAKPKNPPGGGEEPPGGVVYFETYEDQYGYVVYEMKGDGSDKTLVVGAQGGTASRELHGGLRWFLNGRGVLGLGVYYPDREPLAQLVAYAPGGLEVVLLHDKAVRPSDSTNQRHWLRNTDDEWISFGGRRWLVDPETGEYVLDQDGNGIIVDEGVYVAQVEFDPDTGLPTGLVPGTLTLAVPTMDLGGTLNGHDWSPDGTRAVLAIYHGNHIGDLLVADLTAPPAQMFSLLYPGDDSSVSRPVWSPDGSRIAFNSSNGITILDLNTRREKAIRSNATFGVGGPSWSPGGEYLIYHQSDHSFPFTTSIYRVTASGGEKANLTPEPPATEGVVERHILGWRE